MTRFLSLILGFILSFAALAQPYPSRAVKIIVPFGPGGTADTLGRLVAGKLSDQLKETFVSENKGGGVCVVGSELFKREAGIDVLHVPYKGAAAAVTDLMGGQITAVSTTLSTASGQIKAGRARALALSSAQRLPDYPDIPTFVEQGFPNIIGTVWFSLSGPAGMPQEIVDKLNAEVRRALEVSDVRAKLRHEGIVPNRLEAKEFTAFVTDELHRWGPTVRASGAKKD